MPKNYWLPKDERTVRAQTAKLKELREEMEAENRPITCDPAAVRDALVALLPDAPDGTVSQRSVKLAREILSDVLKSAKG